MLRRLRENYTQTNLLGSSMLVLNVVQESLEIDIQGKCHIPVLFCLKTFKDRRLPERSKFEELLQNGRLPAATRAVPLEEQEPAIYLLPRPSRNQKAIGQSPGPPRPREFR